MRALRHIHKTSSLLDETQQDAAENSLKLTCMGTDQCHANNGSDKQYCTATCEPACLLEMKDLVPTPPSHSYVCGNCRSPKGQPTPSLLPYSSWGALPGLGLTPGPQSEQVSCNPNPTQLTTNSCLRCKKCNGTTASSACLCSSG